MRIAPFPASPQHRLVRPGRRRRWRVRVGAACLAAVTLAAPAASPAEPPLTIERALEIALAQNPDVQAQRQRLEIARGALIRARYWNPFNPEVGGGAMSRRFDAGGSDVQASASLSIEIEVAGQRGKRIATAERELERVRAEVRDFERQLRADVERAFYGALYRRRRLDLLRRVEALNRRMREASRGRFRAGEVAKLEANLASIRYAQSRAETLAAEREHRNALRRLERLLGQEPRGAIELAGGLRPGPVAADLAPLLDRALASRPDLRARDAEIRRVDAETALTRRLIVPNPTIELGYDEETEQAGSRDRLVGGQIRIPLPVFDRRRAELTALAGRRSRARFERRATELALRQEVRDAYRAYRATSEALEAFEGEALGDLAESFRFIETAYREGKIGLIELVVVQNDLVGAEISYLQTIWEGRLARIDLEQAVGEPLDRGGAP